MSSRYTLFGESSLSLQCCVSNNYDVGVCGMAKKISVLNALLPRNKKEFPSCYNFAENF